MTRRLRAWRARWNWKSALVSSVCRSVIFLAVNLPAGGHAAARAMLTELAFRAVASGFFGAMTEALARRPASAATTAAALIVVPGAAHAMEYVVHRMAGTPMLAAAVGASIAFSVLTTLFNLHAMRRGALVSGEGGGSLFADLRQMPALLASFAAAAVGAARSCLR